MTGRTRPIGVTGATGRLGGRIADRLAAHGIPQRLLVRDPSRAPQLPRATAVSAPYGEGDAVREGLTGIDTVLMVSAAETPDRVRQHQTFIDAAVAAGISHLVYISFYGAAPTATFTLARDHWATEQHIQRSGLSYTFLRDNLYADFLPQMVGDDGVIRGPGGTGRVAAVAQDDIADAAAAVLQDPAAHAGATFELTGPEALTLEEIVAALSRVTGRNITYRDETLEEAYASRAIFGAPDWQVDAWVSTYTAIADGSLAQVTDAIPDLTGHPATPLIEVCRRRS